VNHGEPGQVEREGVGLVELEGVAGHPVGIDTDDVEPCPVVSHRRAACAAEQV
jgi:hypothetical protein